MASPRGNPALIGGFVVGAFVLAATAIIVFGSGQMFQDRTPVVSFFDGAVTGLDIGAPVIFRGVEVGQVKEITAMIEPRSFETLVRVRYDLVEGPVEVIGEWTNDPDDPIEQFVEAGLRAQLKSQSMITGKLYVDLARHTETDKRLRGIEPGVLEIPTIPTSMQMFERDLRELIKRFKALPLEKMVRDVAATVEGVKELIEKPEMGRAIDNLESTLQRADRVLAQIDDRVGVVSDDLQQTVRDLGEAADAAESALVAVQSTIQPGSALHVQLMETLSELQATLRSLRTLADEMSEEPEQLLFGKPTEETP